ncbi:MAG TPA: adenylate/guanylate cyclase domain-containing protein, partial [Silvibacterium sp.]|nr:adenylate/guanylate cyclase domain-containing protein [Silvibacterium sp.]
MALVFTDMVGSSAAKRATALGSDVSSRDQAYLEEIQIKYLRLVRSAVAEFRGQEIMTMGDSFFLTFSNPVDAIRCAAAIQQSLNAQPIDTPTGPMQLRIGVHVGTPLYFEDSWHGTDVDIAARAQSAGSPGQIVITEAAREMIGSTMDILLRPLGTFALKGVGDVRLWNAAYGYKTPRRAAIASKEQLLRTRIGSSAALLLMLLSLIGTGMWRLRDDHVAAVQASTRQPIAVSDFENL